MSEIELQTAHERDAFPEIEPLTADEWREAILSTVNVEYRLEREARL